VERETYFCESLDSSSGLSRLQKIRRPGFWTVLASRNCVRNASVSSSINADLPTCVFDWLTLTVRPQHRFSRMTRYWVWSLFGRHQHWLGFPSINFSYPTQFQRLAFFVVKCRMNSATTYTSISVASRSIATGWYIWDTYGWSVPCCLRRCSKRKTMIFEPSRRPSRLCILLVCRSILTLGIC